MLRPRWYKVINDLFGNKTRTVLIVLSMAVGLFAIGIILSARTILSDGLTSSFASIYPSSGVVRTIEPFDEDFLQSVRAMPEVQEADARRDVPAHVEVSPGEWKDITLFVIADYNDIRVNKVISQSGAWPPPKHEILIERDAFSVINAHPGDTLHIKLASNVQRDMHIAGIAYDPAQLPAPIDGTPYAYISNDTLQWLGESFGFNEIDVIATHPEDKVWAQHVVNLVKDKAERSGYTIPLSMSADPGQLPMNDILQGILLLMGFLGVLSLFLSIFLVINTVSALLAQQKRQIAVMKAIGGSSLQILGMYLVMVMCYGVLALLIAVPLSGFGARALSQVLAAMFNFNLAKVKIPLQTILVQVAIGLILPIAASLYPFLSSLRVSAAEAMSTYSTGKGRFGMNWIDKFLSGANLWFLSKLSFRSILLSVRNTFRKKGRLALTLMTLTLASATFISVFNMRASLSSTIDDMMKVYNFDVWLTFDQAYRAQMVQEEASNVPGVVKTDVWLQLPARRVRPDGSESGMMYMFAPHIDGGSLIRSATITEGRWLTPQDDNAVVVPSALLKDETDLGIGKDLVLKIYGKDHPFEIVGTYVGTSYAPVIYANYEYIARIADRTDQADSLLLTTRTHDPTFVQAESNILEKYFEHLGLHIESVTTLTNERAETEAVFNSVVALLFVMAVLLAFVGGLGLMGTMSINVLERTREIGVLRAIGASNRGVAQVFILEGVTIGMLSWLFGSLLAIPISQGLDAAVGTAMLSTSLTYTYSIFALWLWLLIVILLSAIASFIPAHNASHLTVREVLAYE